MISLKQLQKTIKNGDTTPREFLQILFSEDKTVFYDVPGKNKNLAA